MKKTTLLRVGTLLTSACFVRAQSWFFNWDGTTDITCVPAAEGGNAFFQGAAANSAKLGDRRQWRWRKSVPRSGDEQHPAEPTLAAPTQATEVQPVPTSRGPDLEATDPAMVSLASGQLQPVEFFRFT